MEQPPFPDEFACFLPWLAALPCPLEWPDLVAWQTATRRMLARWEIDLLMRLDRIRQ